MRARGLAFAVVLGFVVSTGVAHAAAPVLGGQFVDHGRAQGYRYSVKLTVTNDGGEFQAPSWAEYKGRGCGAAQDLSSWEERPASTRVRSGGRFLRGFVQGRFVERGRVAVGSLGVFYCGKKLKDIPFRAQLKSRPNGPFRASRTVVTA